MRKPEAKFERITPTKAKRMLENNTANYRRLSVPYAKKMATVILRGDWNEDAIVPIQVDREGRVIDGQHRLMAIMIAGVPLRLMVIYGASSDIGLDSGKKRNRGDLIRKYCNQESPKVVATLAVELIDSMRLGYDLAHRGGGSCYQRGATDREVIDLVNRFEDQFAKAAATPRGSSRVTNPSQFKFIRLLSIPEHDETGATFCDRLRTGEGLPANSPITALRDGYTNALGAARGGTVSRWTRAGLFGIAWEKYLMGSRASRIRLPKGHLTDPPGLEAWRDLTGIELENLEEETRDDAQDRPNAAKPDSAAAKRGKGRAGKVDSGRGRPRADRGVEGPRANP